MDVVTASTQRKATLFEKVHFSVPDKIDVVVVVVVVVVVAFTTVVGALFESDTSVTNHAKAFFLRDDDETQTRSRTNDHFRWRYKIADKTQK